VNNIRIERWMLLNLKTTLRDGEDGGFCHSKPPLGGEISESKLTSKPLLRRTMKRVLISKPL